MSAKTVAWRCFHCDEVFTDHATAALHFGNSEHHHPACQIDIAEYRRMEETHRRHCEEDTDLHREIHAAHSAGNERARRAEEQGYARGLSDFQAEHTRAEQLAAELEEAKKINEGLCKIQDDDVSECEYIHNEIDRAGCVWVQEGAGMPSKIVNKRAERAEAALREANDILDALCKQFTAAGISPVLGSNDPGEWLHARAAKALGRPYIVGDLQ